jgi:hypothetical protein
MPELGGHLDLGNISNDRKMRDDKIRELVIERKKLREPLIQVVPNVKHHKNKLSKLSKT